MERNDKFWLPLDGSELAETALPHAVMLAHTTSSALTLLRAVPLPVMAAPLLAAVPVDTLAFEM